MDGESVQKAAEAADHAAKHTSFLSEAFFAAGAAVAGWVGARRFGSRRRNLNGDPESDTDAIVRAIREQGEATRKVIYETSREESVLLNEMNRQLGIVLDRSDRA